MDAVCLLLIVPDGKESSDGRAVTHESDKHWSLDPKELEEIWRVLRKGNSDYKVFPLFCVTYVYTALPLWWKSGGFFAIFSPEPDG